MALDRLDAGDPEARGLVVFLSSDSPTLSVDVIRAWLAAALPFFLRLGTGVISSDRRRPATGGLSVGCPSASRSWCHRGGW
jgi:hypothetical protein